MNLRVLVTGGGGHIGRALVRILVARGDVVCVLDCCEVRLDGTRCVIGDVADAASLDALFADFRPERVVHLAAMLTGASEAEPQAAFRANVIGTHNVLESCARHGVSQLVFSSSVGTFGRGAGEATDDYTLQRPTTHYGVAKLLGENLGCWYGERYGFDFRALRFPQVVGPGIRTPRHWAPPMIEDALLGRRHRCVEGGRGSLVHAMSVADAARATLELGDASANRIRTRCYNVLGLPAPMTAEQMAEVLGRRVSGFTVDFLNPGPAQLSRGARYDDRYARDEWGWQPSHRTLDHLLDEFHRELRAPSEQGAITQKTV